MIRFLTHVLPATAALAMVLIAFSHLGTPPPPESVEARYESRAMNHEWG